MDYTLLFEMFPYLTVICRNGCSNDNNRMHKRMAIETNLRAKNVRLTQFQLNKQHNKMRLILLLLGLWMSFIPVTNGK